ncbi:MAG TPA: tetratricopeptide repeat protein, partial [Pirellulales bacterium]|nr:tetratricopeptide repeat protein [Pirellulales bacterium]
GIAAAQHNLGMVALVENRFEQADDLFNDALEAERRAVERAGGPTIGTTLISLAEVARIEADYKRAESYLSEADNALPASSPVRTAWLAARAALDADLGHYDQAIAGYKSAIQSIESAAPHQPFAAVLKIRGAEVEQNAGRLEEAEALARDGLAGIEVTGVDRTAAKAQGLRVLGTIEVRRGHRQTARQQFDTALKIIEPPARSDEMQIDSHPETLDLAALVAARASAADSPETYTAAIADCERAVAIVERVFGPRAAHHPLTARYEHVLAKIDIRRGKLLAAEQLLRQALAIDEAVLPKDHPATVAVLDDLATTLKQTGREQEGRAFADRAKKLKGGGASTSFAPMD